MNKKKITIILIVLNVILLGASATLSSYKSHASGVSELEVAKIIFNNQEYGNLDIPLDPLMPNDTTEVEFGVSNNKNNIRSETKVKYSVVIKTYNVLPKKITLKKGSTTVKECTYNQYLTTTVNTFESGVDGAFACTAPAAELDFSTNITHNYTLEITILPMPLELAGAGDYLNITIDTWQKQD